METLTAFQKFQNFTSFKLHSAAELASEIGKRAYPRDLATFYYYNILLFYSLYNDKNYIFRSIY